MSWEYPEKPRKYTTKYKKKQRLENAKNNIRFKTIEESQNKRINNNRWADEWYKQAGQIRRIIEKREIAKYLSN